MDMTATAEIWWDLDHEDPNWKWCSKHATFAHRDACEYVLYIGGQLGETTDDIPYWKLYVEDMRNGGCTEDFIAAYLAAKDAGAVRVIFYC